MKKINKIGKTMLGAVSGAAIAGIATASTIPLSGVVLSAGAIAKGAMILGAGTAVGNEIKDAVDSKVPKAVLKERFNGVKDVVDSLASNSVVDKTKNTINSIVPKLNKYNFSDSYCVAAASLSYYMAMSDGSISQEEEMEMKEFLSDLKTSCSKYAVNKMDEIANKKYMNFKNDVICHLDKLSCEELYSFRSLIHRIIVASEGILPEEKRAEEKFESYLTYRLCNESKGFFSDWIAEMKKKCDELEKNDVFVNSKKANMEIRNGTPWIHISANLYKKAEDVLFSLEQSEKYKYRFVISKDGLYSKRSDGFMVHTTFGELLKSDYLELNNNEVKMDGRIIVQLSLYEPEQAKAIFNVIEYISKPHLLIAFKEDDNENVDIADIDIKYINSVGECIVNEYEERRTINEMDLYNSILNPKIIKTESEESKSKINEINDNTLPNVFCSNDDVKIEVINMDNKLSIKYYYVSSENKWKEFENDAELPSYIKEDSDFSNILSILKGKVGSINTIHYYGEKSIYESIKLICEQLEIITQYYDYV